MPQTAGSPETPVDFGKRPALPPPDLFRAATASIHRKESPEHSSSKSTGKAQGKSRDEPLSLTRSPARASLYRPERWPTRSRERGTVLNDFADSWPLLLRCWRQLLPKRPLKPSPYSDQKSERPRNHQRRLRKREPPSSRSSAGLAPQMGPSSHSAPTAESPR